MKKYTNDYDVHEAPRKNGRGTRTVARYVGAYWHPVQPEAYRRTLLLLFSLLAAMTALVARLGLMPSGALSREAQAAYVLTPYAAMMLPLGVCWSKAIGLACCEKGLLERREHDDFVVRRRGWTLALLICAGLLTVGGVIFLLLHRGAETFKMDARFCADAALLCVMAGLLIRVQDTQRFERGEEHRPPRKKKKRR